MCGRVLLVSDVSVIMAQYQLQAATPVNFPAHWNAAPSEMLPIIRWNPKTRQRCIDPMKWGLLPAWAKDEKVAFTTFNAKSETIATKPAFRDAWRAGRRGILPLNGFYEWKQLAAKAKQPYRISRVDGRLLSLAVLWESRWLPNGEVLRTFTIITTEANDMLAPLHHRMPVILDDKDIAAWLGETAATEAEIASLLRPCPPAWLELVPVDPRMSNARNQGEEFCRPMTPVMTPVV
jgi:putative SOS response-associated peptidase YedK